MEFEVQGHRGARGHWPENTLAGFAATLEVGVHTLELDVGMTRDGVLVVSHNPHLEPELTRDVDGEWLEGQGPAIRDLDLAQLKSYDVGRLKPDTAYRARFPDQVAIDGERTPTLDEVVTLVQSAAGPPVGFTIEVKTTPKEPGATVRPEALAEAVVEFIKARGVEALTTVQGFDWRVPLAVQSLAPDIATAYLTVELPTFDTVCRHEPEPSPWHGGFDLAQFDGSLPRMVAATGGGQWTPHHESIDAADVRLAQDLGLRVVPWTVNEQPRMAELIDVGVDGIITDYPDRLRKVMTERGMTLPQPARPALRTAD